MAKLLTLLAIAAGFAGADRQVLPTGDVPTSAERRYLLQQAEDGYTCWLLKTFSRAVCIENFADTSVVPTTGEDLRHVLYSVNLRTWLPNLLCSPKGGITFDSESNKADDVGTRRKCHEVVEDAWLASTTSVDAQLTSKAGAYARTISTIDDLPWVKAMDTCLDPVFTANFDPEECRTMYTVLAAQRGKRQLLPALQHLWRQLLPQQLQQGIKEKKLSPRASNQRPYSSLSSLPLVEPIKNLMSLLNGDVRHDAVNLPVLRLLRPSAAARISGGSVPFILEVRMGVALHDQLSMASTNNTYGCSDDSRGSSGNEGCGGNSRPDITRTEEAHVPTSAPLVGDASVAKIFKGGATAGSCTSRSTAAAPSFCRCEVQVVTDGTVVSRIPLIDNGDDVTTTTPFIPEEDLDSTSGVRERTKETTLYTVKRAVIPDYNKPRCSAHPSQSAVLAAGAGWDGSGADQAIWRLEARQVDRVCSRDAFGSHSMHGELVCCSGGVECDPDNPDSSDLEEACETLEISEPVEYFHTGNLEDLGTDSSAGSLFNPPSEDISVSLYLEKSPGFAVSFTVTRWSSDAEVWEDAFEVCSEAFGPSQGVLINTIDCVDLLTTAVSAKRVDLYNRMVLRLNAYLRSKHDDLTVEGHTGRSPEKVEALGAMPRNGGDRSNQICEVGFNAGHSSLNWLLNSHPSARVLAFDLGQHEYVDTARTFLQAVFPNRLVLVLGDSGITVPAYSKAEAAAGRDPRACDVIFVDGNHSEEGTYADLVNFRAITSRDWHAFALDDLDIPSVSSAWRRFSREEGKGRLERVVQASIEINTNATDTGNGGWDFELDVDASLSFVKKGHFSLGVGIFRLRP